jgi:hypothetical protein
MPAIVNFSASLGPFFRSTVLMFTHVLEQHSRLRYKLLLAPIAKIPNSSVAVTVCASTHDPALQYTVFRTALLSKKAMTELSTFLQ